MSHEMHLEINAVICDEESTTHILTEDISPAYSSWRRRKQQKGRPIPPGYENLAEKAAPYYVAFEMSVLHEVIGDTGTIYATKAQTVTNIDQLRTRNCIKT